MKLLFRLCSIVYHQSDHRIDGLTDDIFKAFPRAELNDLLYGPSNTQLDTKHSILYW